MAGEPALGRGGGSSGEKGSGKNPESLSRRSLRQSEGEQAQGEHHHNEQAHGNIIIIAYMRKSGDTRDYVPANFFGFSAKSRDF